MNDLGAAQQTKPPRRRRWGCLALVVAAIVLGCTIWIPIGHGGLPILLLPVAVVYNLVTHMGQRVATIGEPLGGDISGMTLSVSDRFGKDELRRLYERLTSESFHSALTNYNCGDPVPQFKFSISLGKRVPAAARHVNVNYSPKLGPAGRTRCLMFRMDEMVKKTCAGIDLTPGRPPDDQYVMQCDCSKRDGNEEWVTYKVSSAPPQQ